MLNLLRSDGYRLCRSGMFWVFLALIAAFMVAVPAMMAYFSSPEFTVMVNDNLAASADLSLEEREEAVASLAEAQELGSTQLASLTVMWANAFLNGGFIGILTAAFAALFLISDFKSGFIKTLPMGPRERVRYYSEKLVVVALVDALFLGVALVVSTIAYGAFGFTYQEADAPGAIVLWVFLAWLALFAYSCLAACIAWLTRSEGLSVAFVVIVCSCVAGAVLVQLAALLGAAFPLLDFFPYWTLVGSISSLSEGAGALLAWNGSYPIPDLHPWGQVLLVEVLYVAAALVVVFVFCRKRDAA